MIKLFKKNFLKFGQVGCAIAEEGVGEQGARPDRCAAGCAGQSQGNRHSARDCQPTPGKTLGLFQCNSLQHENHLLKYNFSLLERRVCSESESRGSTLSLNTRGEGAGGCLELEQVENCAKIWI